MLRSEGLAVLLGLLSALAYALGLVLQQRGALQTRASEGRAKFLREVIAKPVWLLGVVSLVVGWAFQAAALHFGSLALVQSIQALSLVFALPLGVALSAQHVDRRSVLGASIALVGIVTFVLVGQPGGGVPQPGTKAWLLSGLITVALMAVLAVLAWRRRGGVAAALFATGAGVGFAFQAAATKMLVAQLDGGLVRVLTSWPLYVFALAELAGFTLQQWALKTGRLAPATAALNCATLAVSFVLGITVFQESLAAGLKSLLPALLGLVLAIVGVVVLATSQGLARRTPVEQRAD